jgi:hypothetical protein
MGHYPSEARIAMQRSSTSTVPGRRIVPERLFVVQLHDQGQDGLQGQVENVATGEQMRFESLQELDGFMRRTASCQN